MIAYIICTILLFDIQFSSVGEDEHLVVWPGSIGTAAQKKGHQGMLAASNHWTSCSGGFLGGIFGSKLIMLVVM